MHARIDLLQAGNDILGKFVSITGKEAVIIVTIFPVAGLQHFQIATIDSLAITMKDGKQVAFTPFENSAFMMQQVK